MAWFFKVMNSDQVVPAVSCVLMAFMIPLAILISRDRLRENRRGLLLALEQWLYRTAEEPPITSFEAARIKYEMGPRDGDASNGYLQTYGHTSWRSYVLPASIYSGVLALGFVMAMFLSHDATFWAERNLILSGIGKLPEGDLLILYQRNTGAAITAGLIGAFLFTLQYLVQRVRSYELSPLSFLIAAITLLEGCFVVAIARHVLAARAPWPAYTGLAFLIGYFPTFGITWLVDHMRVRQLKQVDRAAYLARYVMPTDMIDGIDMLTKFRLMEAGVRDVQGLATANPILLYVETPYTLLSILDWMGQAQLIVALGSRPATALRAVGIRTVRNLAGMDITDTSRAAVLGMVWPSLAQGSPAEHFTGLVAMLAKELHVQRLDALIDTLGGLTSQRQGRAKGSSWSGRPCPFLRCPVQKAA